MIPLKVTLQHLILLLSVILMHAASSHAENPLKVDGGSFYGADPSALVTSDGRLFMFPTTDNLDWDKQIGWSVYSSEDLVNWKDHGVIFDFEDSGWATNNAWAPDITEKNGKFYFYYYFRNSGKDTRGVGVAVADQPEGPYKEALGKPLLIGHDPAVFNDDDGTSWLYVQDRAYELGEDMISIKTGPINLGLEYRPKKFEAAYVFKRNDIYYFTIARAWNNLIYYTGESPTGPFNLRGEIMKPYGGNNHHSIVKYKGQWIIFHHEWVKGKPGHEGRQRRIRAEYLHFNDDGTIQLVSPTKEGISLATLGKD